MGRDGQANGSGFYHTVYILDVSLSVSTEKRRNHNTLHTGSDLVLFFLHPIPVLRREASLLSSVRDIPRGTQRLIRRNARGVALELLVMMIPFLVAMAMTAN